MTTPPTARPAPDAAPATAAAAQRVCPLCAGPNACAMAGGGPTDAPCWCRSATFSAPLLARAAAAGASSGQGLACICAACAATAAQAAAGGPGQP